jgi:hypothetical protein
MMKRLRTVLGWVLVLSCAAVQAKIFVATPESVTLTTASGLTMQFSNQMEGITNNDALAYLVISATNKSRRLIRISPQDFKLTDEGGNVVASLSGGEALRTAVEWNFERAEGYVRIAGADLREVLRDSLKRSTTEKEFTAVGLKPKESVKDKALFFPRLPQGRYFVEIGGDKLQLQVTDTVYFVRAGSDKPKSSAELIKPKN